MRVVESGVLLTVLEQHVDGVERRPADGEQQHDGDHHLHRTFLLPVSKKDKTDVHQVDRCATVTASGLHFTGSFL